MKLKSQRLGTLDFPDEYDVVQVTTLNKTDLTGGNNKYYQIEAHVSKDGTKFRLYSRYGRVGHSGTEEERIPPQNRSALDAAFTSLKNEKTTARKGYREVKMAATKVGSRVANQQVLSDDIKTENLTQAEKTESSLTLPPSVAQLVTRLYEEAGQAVRSQLSGNLRTSAENPLGTLTLSQIEEGRRMLRAAQELLTRHPERKHTLDPEILEISNEFYSAIPQKIALRPKDKEALERWLQTMALNNEDILDDKEALLELLADVQGLIGGFETSDVEVKYREIGCHYEPLRKDDESYRTVEAFVRSTRSKHHSWRTTVKNIWRVTIRGQKERHLPTMKQVGNIQPLFHGSRSANILGICKHGLLLRPPGAYVTGSMFGNGLYFADQSSKSEQYSMARFGGGHGRGDTLFLFVADVALGKIRIYDRAQTHLQKPPPGYDSVQGKKGGSLLHNEFIIYELEQHLLQYLIEFHAEGSY